MKVVQFFSLVLLFAGLGACNPGKKSQNSSNSNKGGVIEYSISLDLNEDAATMEKTFGDAATATFNQDYLHFVKNNNQSANGDFQIVNLNTGEEVNYLTIKDKKFALKIPKEQLPSVGQFAYYPDVTKEIAGYKCKQARARMGDGELVVFYTQEIGVNFCPYADLNGFALEYTLHMHYGDVTYTANQVNLQSIDPTKVQPPTGYKSVTPKDIEAEMMGDRKKMEEGYKDANFTKLDMDGNEFTLSGYYGNVVVINFWFSACKPCELEMPDLNKLQQANSGKNIKFVAITFDDKNTVNDFLKRTPFNFKIIPDAHDVIKQYDIFAYPTTVILDKTGKLSNMKMGGSGNIQLELQKMIDEALKI